MKKLFLFGFLFILIGTGCTSKLSNELSYSNKFQDLSTYTASDFDLNGDYTYWEVRVHDILSDTLLSKSKTLFSYGRSAFQKLPAKQQKKINDIASKKGFNAPWCGLYPHYLPFYYIVAANNDSVKVINSYKGMIAFFGTIDTEAELHYLLVWAPGYYTKQIAYKKVGSGYRVVVRKGCKCPKHDKDIISVTKSGKITELKTLSTKNPPCIY